MQVDAGRVLVSEGATGAEFFVILTGTAKVSRRGRKVATLGPGAAFGDRCALLDKAPRNATVTAETPMELVVLGQREFGGVIDEVPGVACKLLTGMARRLRGRRPLRAVTPRADAAADHRSPDPPRGRGARSDLRARAADVRRARRHRGRRAVRPRPRAVDRWRPGLPDARPVTDGLDELLAVDADVVDVLVPTPAHADVAMPVLDAGFHVQVQKPIARSLEDACASRRGGRANGTMLRVLEDYVFYPPLVQLRDVVRSGEIGDAGRRCT